MSAGGRKIFLGGLTKSTTTDMLFESFGVFGQVVDAVVMERNGHPRGFGFVTYKDKASVGKAIAAGVTIDGREVDLKRAVPEEEMVFCPSKVFVGGLSQTVDKSALKAHFEAFGEVRDAVVMMDRATSRSRGFGFVRFATAEGVEAALQTPHLLDGQWIDVKRAQPADALPPPKYPRTRAEEEADPVFESAFPRAAPKKNQRSAPKRAPMVPPAPAPAAMGYPAPDMAAQLAMWNWLSMQQQTSAHMMSMMQWNAAAAAPFGFPPLDADVSALLATISQPMKEVEKKEEVGIPLDVLQPSPLGDRSNVPALASPAKSPIRRAASPDAENALTTPNGALPVLPVA